MKAAALVIAIAAAPASAQSTAQLQLVCKQFVEKTLNDPRDAQLEEWTNASVQQRKDGLWQVRFPGRAKNQYGALMRGTFECVIRHTGGDNFSAVQVRVF